ncbi:biotinidase [Labeo rohita]|uniref:Biotinidase n=1 Tax=Labeo rohita TaxID=84645 RepID=A0A498LYJ5_LABRO|nr:biotinidase [Labeo rohita]
MFRDPAVTLVKEMGVRQIVFPTAWMDHLPLLASVQFQRAFSYGAGITMLAANLKATKYRMTGSGIYTPWDSLTHHDTEGDSGKLLVHRVPVIVDNKHKLVPFSGYPSSKEPEKMHAWPVSSLNANYDGKHCQKECAKEASSSPFNSMMMNDNFTLVALQGTEGNISVCSGSVCCHLLFRRSETKEFYALGVFDGLHGAHKTYYLEICALVRCTGEEQSSCGGETEHAQTLVDFRLTGTFTTPYIYPGILGNGMTVDIPDHSGDSQFMFGM